MPAFDFFRATPPLFSLAMPCHADCFDALRFFFSTVINIYNFSPRHDATPIAFDIYITVTLSLLLIYMSSFLPQHAVLRHAGAPCHRCRQTCRHHECCRCDAIMFDADDDKMMLLLPYAMLMLSAFRLLILTTLPPFMRC